MSTSDKPTKAFSEGHAERPTGSLPVSVSDLSVEQQLLLDEACNTFEAKWNGKGRPDILAALLELPENMRPVALKELVALDVFYRRRAGENPTAGEYAERFPELAADWLAGIVAGIDSPSTGEPTLHTARAAERIGTVIAGKYTLIESIGVGGMGSVYLARQSEPVKRDVALKLIKSGLDSKTVLARFDAERQALALMDHPNIARVYDGGSTAAGQPFFVMELVNGVPITQFCDQKRLPIPARLELFVQVCQAVQHAHQKGIIHRDLKPGNVLVTEVDGRPTPKVIDFGVAEATEQRLTDLSFADTGSIVGTPMYMSPEQADPSSMDIDTRTDVYALGVMLYELLTGSPPHDASQFRRGAILEMLRMVREVEPPRPSTKLSTADALPNIAANRDIEPARLARLLRGELDWVVMKALEKDRDRRYGTALAFAQDVQRYLADEVVEARPPSRGYRLRKFVRRNKGQVIAATLVIASLVGGVVALAYSRTLENKNRALEIAKANTEEQKAEADRQRIEADTQRARAEREETESWRLLYFSRMHQANLAFQAGSIERVIELLTPYREPTPGKPDPRGFEWHYLWKMARGDLFTIRAHPGGILSVAYSLDGQVIATGGADGTVRLWDARNGAAGAVFDAGSGQVRATGVGFVPGTTWLAASLSNAVGGELRFWDLATGQVVREVKYGGRVHGFAIHPDGKHVAAACDDGLVQVVNLETSAVRDWKNDGPANSVAFSPDGKRFAAGGLVRDEEGDELGWIRVWEWPDGRELAAPLGKRKTLPGAIVDLAFSPDATAILWTAGRVRNQPNEYNRASVFDLGTTAEPRKRILWCSPNGENDNDRWHQARFLQADHAVLVSDEGGVSVFDLRKDPQAGGPVRQYAGHHGPVLAVAVSPDQRFMVSVGRGHTADEPGELRVWFAGAFSTPVTVVGDDGLSRPPSGVTAISISPDGRYVATPFQLAPLNPGVRVYSAATGTEIVTRPVDGACFHTLFSPDGKWLAATRDGGATVWRTEGWTQHYNAGDNSYTGVRLAFSPDSRWLAVGGGGLIGVHDLSTRRRIRLWRVDSRANLDEGYDEEVNCVAFSHDGFRLLTASHYGLIRVWQVETGVCELTFRAHTSNLTTAAFSPDGRRIVTSGMSGHFSVHNASDGRRIMTPAGHSKEFTVYWCGYTPDGTRILTASRDGTLRLWSADNGQELLTIRQFEDAWGVTTAAISADGMRIAVNCGDRQVRMIDVPAIEPNENLDVRELVRTHFAQLADPGNTDRVREAVLKRLRTEPGLAPGVRAAAIKVAESMPTKP